MLNIICNKITDGVLTSTAVDDATRSEAVTTISGNLPQSVKVTVYPSSGNATIELDTSNIIQDTFTINRSCASSGSLEVGSVMAAQLDFEINNSSNEFNAAIFEGKRLYAELSTPKVETTANGKVITTWYVIPLGYFNIDEVRRTTKSIIITALDDMTKFDKVIPTDFVDGKKTVADLIWLICQNCGVTFNDVLGILDEPCFVNNFNYIPQKTTFDGNSTTYRQILSWCCQILGKNAYIDSSGKLQIKWFSESGVLFRPSQCFEMERNESAIKVTGVKKTAEGKDYLYGSDDYALDLAENQLINHGINGVIEGIYKEISVPVGSGEDTVYEPFSYHPFTATFLPSVFFEPMDKFSYMTTMTGSSEDQIQLAITDVTIALNANTVLNGTGDTQTIFNYGDLPTFSSSQISIINKKNEQTKQEVKEEIKELNEKFKEETVNATADFNKIIANGMGLYQIKETDSSGNTIYVYCNNKTVKESTYIMKIDTSGFAFAKSESAFNVETSAEISNWQYGINSNGNAILNYLYTNKLTSDYINVLNATIGGFTIKDGYMRYGSDGNMDYGTDGTDGFYIYPGNPNKTNPNVISIGKDGKFKVNKDGTLVASGATISGTIYVDKILFNNTNTKISSDNLSDSVVVENKLISSADGSFNVTNEGILTAVGANINGKITAESGTIAGFEIAGDTYPSNGFWKKSLSAVITTDTEISNYKTSYAAFLRNSGILGNVILGLKKYAVSSGDVTRTQWDSAEYVFAISNKGVFTSNTLSFNTADSTFKIEKSIKWDGGKITFLNNSKENGSITTVVDANVDSTNPCFVFQSHATNSSGLFITSNANNSWYSQRKTAYSISNSDMTKPTSANYQAHHVFYGSTFFKSTLYAKDSIISNLYISSTLTGHAAKIETIYANTQIIIDNNAKYIWGTAKDIDNYQRMLGVSSANNLVLGADANAGNLNIYAGNGKKIQLQSAAYTKDSVAVTSDRNAKYDFKDFTEIHIKLFDLIEPKIFKYKHGTSDRSHFGLIAQDFEQAILNVGLTTQDVAAIIKDADAEPGEYEYSIRYSELIPLIIYRLKIVLNDIEKIKNEFAERTKT